MAALKEVLTVAEKAGVRVDWMAGNWAVQLGIHWADLMVPRKVG